jgi:hypothetical protein
MVLEFGMGWWELLQRKAPDGARVYHKGTHRMRFFRRTHSKEKIDMKN